MTTEASPAPTPATSSVNTKNTKTSPSWLSSFGRALQDRASRFAARPRNWAIFFGLFCAFHIARALTRELPKPPSLHIALPAFELTNEQGKRFGLDELRGQVWVADFVFTSCPSVCPKLTKRMGEIQHRSRNLGSAFHLVTFTVDPENDTPERLLAYGIANHANFARWSFLTGPLGDVETTVVKGFKTAMGKEKDEITGIFGIFHGERLVLVDREGSIRGYYEATDEGIADLMKAAGILVNVAERNGEVPTSGAPAAEK